MDRAPWCRAEALDPKEQEAAMKMKRPRGMGTVYKRGRIWWIQIRGHKAESSGSVRRSDAEAQLNQRFTEMRLGQMTGADPGRTTYEDLEGMLLADLRANQRRSVEDVERF